MRIRILRILIGTIVVFGIVFGLACTSSSKKLWLPDVKAKREVLPNGLTIIYLEDHSVPVVSYSTWFRVGSAWESKGATGIAHLFEHLMFHGTPRFPGKEFFHVLEGKGAQINAFTQRDLTVYYEEISSEYLERVVDMESDRLVNLTIDQQGLDSERQVVKEERRLRVDSSFEAQQLEALDALAYPGHPYGWPIIGYPEDLDHMTLEACRDFFKRYYQPGNAIVTIAGDFDYNKTRRMMAKYYGRIPGHAVAEMHVPPMALPGVEKRLEIKRPVQAETLMVAYYVPSLYDEDAERLSALSWAVFGMASSRANRKLVQEDKIALAVSADAALQRFQSLFVITVDLKTGESSQKAEAALDALLDEVKRQPFPVEELERVKAKLLYATVSQAKSPGGLAEWLSSGEFYYHDIFHFYTTLERYHKLEPQDLQQVAQKYFKKENRLVVIMKPESSQKRAL